VQAPRGVAQISSVTIAAELGEISRFDRPRQLMGHSGAVPSEPSSGIRIHVGKLLRPAMLICGGSQSRRHGHTDTDP
jgi:transposase